MPPRTGSGMLMTQAPTLPRMPRMSSQQPQAMPALCDDKKRGRAGVASAAKTGKHAGTATRRSCCEVNRAPWTRRL